MLVKRIAIGCDHAGFTLKKTVSKFLADRGISVLDFGTDGDTSVDYPDFGYLVAKAVVTGDADRGILMCGSGIGVSMAANRHPNIRAAQANDVKMAQLCREHNDANIICLGGRIINSEKAEKIIQTFLETEFDGGERHKRRIIKLAEPSLDLFEN